jgi:hypothetical protein
MITEHLWAVSRWLACGRLGSQILRCIRCMSQNRNQWSLAIRFLFRAAFVAQFWNLAAHGSAACLSECVELWLSPYTCGHSPSSHLVSTNVILRLDYL